MTTRRVSYPTIALIGRTNVGKSTLFNKIIEEDRALVSAVPGTTRDRSYGMFDWRGVTLQIADTGGLDVGKADVLEPDVVRQAKLALKEADLVLFIVDLATGPLPQDRELAKILHKDADRVLFIGNKADNPKMRETIHDALWHKLRFGAPIPLSAKNGSGVGDLLDIILKKLAIVPVPQEKPDTKIAIIGRPNVGKSSLVNSLCKEDRVIVSEIAGTTREPQDIRIVLNDHSYLLIDTVGMRRRASGGGKLETAGIEKTKTAIERADVLFLLIDITQPLTSQDRALAGLAEDSGKAVILVVNKWDAFKDKNAMSMFAKEKELHYEFSFFDFAPIRFISAKFGTRVDDLFKDAAIIKAHWQLEIPEKQLDSFFRRTIAGSKIKGPHRPYIYSMKQTGIEPPTFALTTRGKDPMPEAFIRFVENRLREKFDFTGTPIRVRGKNIQVKPQ